MATLAFKRNDSELTDNEQFLSDGTIKNIIKATELPIYTVSTGLFNTKTAREIVGYSGAGECHENKVLTPAMNKLGYMAYVVGGKDEPHLLNHTGKKLGYIKGKWKE